MPDKVKLIVCDVDGTLLKSGEGSPSPSVLKMIDDVRNKGKLFSLSSGRSRNSLLRLFPDSRDIIYISSDGAFASKNNEELFSRPIEPPVIAKIMPYLSASDFVLYGSTKSFASTDYAKELVENAENSAVFPLDEMNETDLIYKLAIFKKRQIPYFAENYIKNNRLLNIIYDKPDLSEYVSTRAGKGEALLYIQSKFSIKHEETAVFGDNLNDISMLKNAYFSYSVGASRPEVRAMARFYAENTADEIVKKFLK